MKRIQSLQSKNNFPDNFGQNKTELLLKQQATQTTFLFFSTCNYLNQIIMKKTKMLFALLVALAIAPFYSGQSCPGNYFSIGDFESFSSSTQLANAVSGSPM